MSNCPSKKKHLHLSLITYTKGTSMKHISIALLLLLLTNAACSAIQPKTIQHILSLSDLHQMHATNTHQITAPYSILSNAIFTSDMDVYEYDQYRLKIVDKQNPDKIIFQVTEKPKPAIFTDSATSLHKQLPWWSPIAPTILKTLDFSKVDGKETTYSIGNSYRLTLLSKQGHWGKAYVLEHIAADHTVKTICTLKLILTRPELNLSVEEFRKRHQKEVLNNLNLADANLDIAIKPYGILEQDLDHYLLFLEYGENAYAKFKDQSLEPFMDQLYDFIQTVNAMHLAGYTHGDLKVDNMLFVNNKLKLCDWYSWIPLNKTMVGKYRYDGDELPPEAMRAFYFGENYTLLYSLVTEKHPSNMQDKNKMIKQAYFLHPIAADRFCLGVSLLERLAPDLYKGSYSLLPKPFNPYKPETLEFWQNQVDYIQKVQNSLRDMAEKTDNLKKRWLLKQIVEFIHVDPLKRKMLTPRV